MLISYINYVFSININYVSIIPVLTYAKCYFLTLIMYLVLILIIY